MTDLTSFQIMIITSIIINLIITILAIFYLVKNWTKLSDALKILCIIILILPIPFGPIISLIIAATA